MVFLPETLQASVEEVHLRGIVHMSMQRSDPMTSERSSLGNLSTSSSLLTAAQGFIVMLSNPGCMFY